MTETEPEKQMRLSLAGAGFSVQKLAETDERRGDFRVSDTNESHIIEVKDKEDSKHFKTLMQEVEVKGGGFSTAPLVPSNRIAAILRDAADQLKRTPGKDDEFRLIWFSCLGEDAGYVLTQAQLTLYGSREVMAYTKGWKMLGTKIAFFFEFNEFFKMPHVDGAVLFGNVGWALCLNSFSPRYQAFKKTRLCSLFKKAVRDPLVLEAEGTAYIVDSDVDRNDQGAVQRFITQKYGLEGVSPMASIEAKGRIKLP